MLFLEVQLPTDFKDDGGVERKVIEDGHKVEVESHNGAIQQAWKQDLQSPRPQILLYLRYIVRMMVPKQIQVLPPLAF
jgi:hypothetical protein